jgi:hypothetical protein
VTLLKRVGYFLKWGGESLIGQQICSARIQALLLFSPRVLRTANDGNVGLSGTILLLVVSTQKG